MKTIIALLFASTVLTNTSAFLNFLGTLDAAGQADALLDTLGPVPAAAGLTLSFAYALNNPWNYVSNGAKMEIVL